MFRVPRELVERWAAMRSDSAQEPAHRLTAWAIRLLMLWAFIDAYRFVMTEWVRPLWGLVVPWLGW